LKRSCGSYLECTVQRSNYQTLWNLPCTGGCKKNVSLGKLCPLLQDNLLANMTHHNYCYRTHLPQCTLYLYIWLISPPVVLSRKFMRDGARTTWHTWHRIPSQVTDWFPTMSTLSAVYPVWVHRYTSSVCLHCMLYLNSRQHPHLSIPTDLCQVGLESVLVVSTAKSAYGGSSSTILGPWADPGMNIWQTNYKLFFALCGRQGMEHAQPYTTPHVPSQETQKVGLNSASIFGTWLHLPCGAQSIPIDWNPTVRFC
jgi:hypothetical protein